MTDAINTTTIPFTATLEIEGKNYPLTRFEVTYMSNTISQAVADFAIGRSSSDINNLNGTTGFQQQVEFERGTAAKLYITVEHAVMDPVKTSTILLPKGEKQLIFSGFVDDTGPSNLSKGSFNIRVSLMSELAKLNTGAVQLNRVVPTSFLNTSCSVIGDGQFAEIAQGIPNFSAISLASDFWKELQRVMTGIATQELTPLTGNENHSILDDIKDELTRLGALQVNTLAAEVLATIKGSLAPAGEWLDPDFNENIAYWLSHQLTDTLTMHSFLTKITDLAKEFKYRLVESPNGIAIVPYSPFFQSKDATVINPSTCLQINWTSRAPESFGGGILTIAGPSSAIEAAGNFETKVAVFVRPGFKGNKQPLGIILPLQSPNWMLTQLRQDPVTGDQQLPFDSIISRVGPGYVKEQILELAYKDRTVQLMCPFRLDIGCLTPVKVVYPKIVGVNDASGVDTAIYGSVQMVKLVADAVEKTASTILEVGYVRSSVQQKAEFDDDPYVHPIWGSRYIGAKLSDSPEVGVTST